MGNDSYEISTEMQTYRGKKTNAEKINKGCKARLQN